MKKTFQKMLQIELDIEDEEKYTTNGVCIIQHKTSWLDILPWHDTGLLSPGWFPACFGVRNYKKWQTEAARKRKVG